FETAVERSGKRKGYIVAFSFTRGAIEEAARAKQKGLEIVLVPVRDVLDEDRARRDSAAAGVGPSPSRAQPTAEEVRQRIIADLAASTPGQDGADEAPPKREATPSTRRASSSGRASHTRG